MILNVPGSAKTVQAAQKLQAGSLRNKSVCRLSSRQKSQVTFVSTSEPVVSGAFDFKSYMTERAQLVHKVLDQVIELEYPEELTEAMRYAILGGGKKVRPALCLAACELFGGDINAAMPAACAMEMIHVMSLVHDDLPCMDDDSFRRGREATHIKYGEDIALLTGDALLAFAFEHVVRDTKGVSDDKLIKVLRVMGKAFGAKGLAGGQTIDIKYTGKEVTVETLEVIHLRKTSALLEAAVISGAIIGGASDADLEKLSKYARNIGLGFQVVDDILDVTQTTEHLGKTAAKDLATDKTTYPKLLGLEKARGVAAELIADAVRQLDGFDKDRAAPLVALALYIRDRTN